MKRYIRAKIDNSSIFDLDSNEFERLLFDPKYSQGLQYISPEALDEALHTTNNRMAFQSILRNQNLLADTLVDYVTHPYDYGFSDCLLDAFRNPNMPLDVLTNTDNYYLCQYIAFNDNTPIEVLETLAQKYPNDKDIIGSVARNPKTPTNLLRQFATNPDSYVRTMLACNEEIPYDIQQILADDPLVSVRGYLAQNSNIETDILEQLAEDESNHVSHEAQYTLKRRGMR